MVTANATVPLAGSDEITVHDLLEEGAEQARAWCEDRAR
jgi:hypothetical protein